MIYNNLIKREIPADWEVKELLSFSSWESASQPPKSEFIYSEQKGYIRFIQNRDYDSDEKISYIPLKSTTKICNEYDIMIDKYGDKTAGTVRYGLKGAYNVALGKIVVNLTNAQEYIRHYLSSKSIFDFLHNACLASTRSSMNETVFKGLYIPIPPEYLLKKFTMLSRIVIDKQLLLKRENTELTKLRNSILPMLMNGQISIA